MEESAIAGVVGDETGSTPPLAEFKLTEDQELRFEVATDSTVLLELVEGEAELFGTELVQHKRYEFSAGARAAVYTWRGCTVELVGKTESAYTAGNTPMAIYLNTHAALEQLRQKVEGELMAQGGGGVASSDGSTATGVRGPRLMIVGPTDVGKSTYCRMLLNYAVRQGRTPIYVDLDIGQGSISVPGTIGAVFIERPADPVEGLEKRSPLVYHFGHLSPAANMTLFDRLVERLADTVTRRCQRNQEANIGGVIINTCGWVKGAGYKSLSNAATALEVDVVVVLDHERLYNDLQRDLPYFVKIVHQPKSGGVEERSREMRIAARTKQINKYFYGTRLLPLFPHTFQVGYTELQIYKIGAAQLPPECMPAGMSQQDHNTMVVKVDAGPALTHRLLGVSSADTKEGGLEDDAVLLRANTIGYICVTDVDHENKMLTVLSPQPHPLPKKMFLWSDILYTDG